MRRSNGANPSVDSNPVRDVPLPHSPNVADAQPLTDEQMRKMWSVLTREDRVVAAFYRLRILVLQRGRQVRMMKWTDLDHTDAVVLEDSLYTAIQDWADGLFRVSETRNYFLMRPQDILEYTQGIRYFIGVPEQRAIDLFQKYLDQLPSAETPKA